MFCEIGKLMGGDLTTAACADNGRGSRIVLLDENVDQRPGASGTSTQAAGREDRVTRGCFIVADVAGAHDLGNARTTRGL